MTRQTRAVTRLNSRLMMGGGTEGGGGGVRGERNRFDVVPARGGLECLEIAAQSLPDAILLDIGMPGIDGVETCQRLKNNPQTQSIPVLMVSANNEDEHILGALEDGLTGLGNRRAMELELENIHATALRFHHAYSVALFDIDFFKRYNDHYGHQAGNELLRSLSDQLSELLRKSDRIYRYGGEEFLLLFPECPPTGAAIITERICASVVTMGYPHCASEAGCVTISAGIAHEAADDRTRSGWETVVGEADKALYMAKDRGRNRVVLWPPGKR